MMKREMMRHRTLTAAVLMTTAVLTTVLVAACGNEEDKAIDTETAITLNVSEEPWETDAVTLTRGGETTLAQLKSSGFGLYCEQLEMENKQVTWDATNNRWDFGNENRLVWPNYNNTAATAYAYAPYYNALIYNSENNKIDYNVYVNADLLWAYGSVTNKGALNLNFQHALAKLSVGTITNSYGLTVTLKSFTITGSYNESGKLSLADGSWTEQTTNNPINPSINFQVADGITTGNHGIADRLFIPNTGGSCPTLTVTFTFGIEGEADIAVSKELTLTQGRHTTINVSIGKNHEVVIL